MVGLRSGTFYGLLCSFMASTGGFAAAVLTRSYQEQTCTCSAVHICSSFSTLKEKGDPGPTPFPLLGLRARRGAHHPGNTFTGPERCRHGDRRSDLLLHVASSCLYCWQGFDAGVAGGTQARLGTASS